MNGTRPSNIHAQPMPLTHADQPGTYAYETRAQAERRVLIQQQSLQAERKRFEGAATVRTLQPGTTFTLREHLSRCHFGTGADKYPDAQTHIEQYKLALAG